MFVGVSISALRTDCYKTPVELKDRLVSFPCRILPVAIGPSLENVVMGQLFEVLSAANTPFAAAMEAAGIESDRADVENAPQYCFFTGIEY